VAYTYREADKHVLMLDAKRVGAFHYADPSHWSARGEHVAMRAGNRLNPKKETWWAYLDGVKVAEEDWIGIVDISPDGSQVCYWSNPGCSIAGDGTYQGGKWFFHVGKQRGKLWPDGLGLIASAFSDDGKRVAAVATGDAGLLKVVIVDKSGEKDAPGVKRGTFLHIDPPVFSPDGRVLYGVKEAPMDGGAVPKDTYVVWGDEIFGKEFEAAGDPVLSSDGKHIAYKIRRDRRYSIAIDRNPLTGAFVAVGRPVFAPGGKKVAWPINVGGEVDDYFGCLRHGETGVKGGQWSVRVGDRMEPGAYDAVKNLTFAPDGETVAYAGKKGTEWFILCGDKRAGPFDDVDRPTFSPNGKQIAFGARIKAELWWKVWTIP
jgi:hypothetical protein